MKPVLSHPAAARPVLQSLASLPVEEIWTLALSPSLELLEVDRTFKGTRDRCLFHPREVLAFVLRQSASNFILAHNHPSGSPRPSEEDFNVTRRMIFLSQTLQIPLLDHLIVTPSELYSFRQSHRGLFEEYKGIEDCSGSELAWISRSRITEPFPLDRVRDARAGHQSP